MCASFCLSQGATTTKCNDVPLISLHTRRENLPPIQLASDAAILGLPGEILWHDLFSKQSAVSDEEGSATGEPADRIVIVRVTQDLHQFLREDLAVVWCRPILVGGGRGGGGAILVLAG
jgi:hypothetical protein